MENKLNKQKINGNKDNKDNKNNKNNKNSNQNETDKYFDVY